MSLKEKCKVHYPYRRVTVIAKNNEQSEIKIEYTCRHCKVTVKPNSWCVLPSIKVFNQIHELDIQCRNHDPGENIKITNVVEKNLIVLHAIEQNCKHCRQAVHPSSWTEV